MKPVLIQHLLGQLKKRKPFQSKVNNPHEHGTTATVFVLILALIILLMVFK